MIPFAVLVIVGSSNAVNLTDGLDGLAIGCTLFVAVAFGVTGYLTSHQNLSNYLDIIHLPANGEVATIFAQLGLIGAGIGFLWYNCHPAEVIMGRHGITSHSVLRLWYSCSCYQSGNYACYCRRDFCSRGLVCNSTSMVISYSTKRIFKMAPLHHHFELIGWYETKVVTRFWIIALILMLIGLSTFKNSIKTRDYGEKYVTKVTRSSQ